MTVVSGRRRGSSSVGPMSSLPGVSGTRRPMSVVRFGSWRPGRTEYSRTRNVSTGSRPVPTSPVSDVPRSGTSSPMTSTSPIFGTGPRRSCSVGRPSQRNSYVSSTIWSGLGAVGRTGVTSVGRSPTRTTSDRRTGSSPRRSGTDSSVCRRPSSSWCRPVYTGRPLGVVYLRGVSTDSDRMVWG